eukprot:CAMPEP_0202920312 /NCGR_PEP_ID=MMETSP1392-20130828/76792_1 /ASSEMBLY_ACC=CAM_ASM_000868 /TAXON_ID=225041 /ORGANISM="Chlamydomonas chlamydogama, Strain SAG 11-48b" /LENGTH=53 /DNA_ID=CAMNT_0049613801 /DNA_START=1208 /DNA_END=1369 /DNA_ORIENTATION=-
MGDHSTWEIDMAVDEFINMGAVGRQLPGQDRQVAGGVFVVLNSVNMCDRMNAA